MAVKGRQQHSRAPRKTGSSSTLVLSFLIILSLFIVILLSLGILSIPGSTKGSPKAHDLSSIAHNSRHSGDEDEDNKDQWVEVISWEPRAFVYHNFLNYMADLNYSHVIEGIYLSPQYHDEGGEISLSIIDQDKIEQVMSKEECDYLISIAEPHMLKSSVVDSETGKSKDSRVRTSSGTFLTRGRDKIVRDIEKRIADFSFIPVEHGEGLQILHYEVGQKYEPHYDYFMDEFNTKNGGQRIATVLMYLSDVEEGGETVFPAAKGNVSSVPWWNELSECAKGGLSVKPRRGDALLFWSMTPDGTLDPSSLHGGCPVIKGNKWSSTKWMRVHEYKV